MTRLFNEFASSGEIVSMALSNSLRFTATTASDEGMFARLDASGSLIKYRAPDNDVKWTDENATEMSLTTTPAEVCTVTPNQDLDPTDSSLTFRCRVDNSDGKDRELTVDFLVDGTIIQSDMMELRKDLLNFQVAYSSGFAQLRPAGSVISIELSCDKDDTLLVRGSLTANKLEVTKAAAAPVTAISVNNFSATPTKVEVLTAIGDSKSSVIVAYDETFDTAYAIHQLGGKLFIRELTELV